jgi:hypothetical protein
MNTLLLKFIKMMMQKSFKVLKFLARFALDTFLRYCQRKEDFNLWQNDYDEYIRDITGKGPFW